MQQTSPPQSPNYAGLPHAIGAYFIWCLFPLYFALLADVPAFEVVVWRLMFTLPFCLAVIVVMRQGPALWAALTNPRLVGTLALSGLLIGANWLTYVIGVLEGHVIAVSLGYYINPLVNVLAGTLFLREKLSWKQWAAVGLAAIGVAILAQGAIQTLWISMLLALSFAGYGLVRKLAPVDALTGLTVETLILLLPALGLLYWQSQSAGGLSMGSSVSLSLLLACAGPLTAIPLMLFATAARKLSLALLGFIQFVTPTGVFALGIFVFGEPLQKTQLICFLFIWSAIAVFCWDILTQRKPAVSESPCEA